MKTTAPAFASMTACIVVGLALIERSRQRNHGSSARREGHSSTREAEAREQAADEERELRKKIAQTRQTQRSTMGSRERHVEGRMETTLRDLAKKKQVLDNMVQECVLPPRQDSNSSNQAGV